MHERFFHKFNQKVPLAPEEEAFLRQYLTLKKLRKKQYWLQEGDVCRNICLIEKGAMRTYVLDNKGNENITAFGLEGWSMGDLTSFIKEEPATLNIDALEDCELTLISRRAYDELLDKMPKFGTYLRLLMTDAYMALQNRTNSSICHSLEERYTAFTETYPNILQRVPQHMIASYMGITPETLSRIRSRMGNRNKTQ